VRQLARTPVPAKPVPQKEADAAYHAQEYWREKSEVEQLEAECAGEIAAIQQMYADRKEPHADARDEHLRLAHAWGEANRGGRKTIKLSNGRELQWRLPSSPSLDFDEDMLDSIVRALMRLKDWSKYLKIELRKNNVKADLGELHKSSRTLRRLLSLDKTEYFRIS
jgi:phage host-nuclease inhibitor protein Gam